MDGGSGVVELGGVVKYCWGWWGAMNVEMTEMCPKYANSYENSKIKIKGHLKKVLTLKDVK